MKRPSRSYGQQHPEHASAWAEELEAYIVDLEKERNVLRAALEGVIRVADRKTDEFDAARAALGQS